jgi:hypothetical protein
LSPCFHISPTAKARKETKLRFTYDGTKLHASFIAENIIGKSPVKTGKSLLHRAIGLFVWDQMIENNLSKSSAVALICKQYQKFVQKDDGNYIDDTKLFGYLRVTAESIKELTVKPMP